MIWLALAALSLMMVLPTVMGLTLARPMSRRARIARTAAVLAEIVAATLIVPWAWFGMAFRWATALAGITAVVVGWARGVKHPQLVDASRRWIEDAVVAAFFGALSVVGLVGMFVPSTDDAVDLQFPLRDGAFVVLHGGGTTLMNQHARVPRGQTDALDVAMLGPGARKATSLRPHDLQEYAIFGQPVYAPCAGQVVARENGIPDRAIESTPTPPPVGTVAGNYIMLACGDSTIILAHLEKGSVLVGVEQRVITGQLLARVGNSGNTTEPHLHIHAVRGTSTSVEDVGSVAPPMGMRFDGRRLTRNDVVRN